MASTNLTQSLLLQIIGDSSGGVESLNEFSDALQTLYTETQDKGGQLSLPFEQVPEAVKKAGETTGLNWRTAWDDVTAKTHNAVADLGLTVKTFGEKVGADIVSGIANPAQFGREALKGVLDLMGPMGVGLSVIGGGISAAGGALGKLAIDAAEAGEEIETFSHMTGMAVEKIGAIKAAAEIGGSSLGEMQSILQQLTRRMDATGPAADKFDAALRDLNINVNDFRAADPTERIAMMSRGMHDAAGSTTLMSDAIALMGRSGAQNLKFLTKDFDDLMQKGKDLAVVWTEEDLAAGEELQQSMATTKVMFANLATTIGKELIPATTLAIQTFNRFVQAVVNTAPVLALAISTMFGPFGIALTVLGELTIAFSKWRQSVNNAKLEAETAGAVQESYNRILADAKKHHTDLGDAVKEAAEKMLNMRYSEETVAKQTGLTKAQVNQLKSALDAAKDSAQAFADVWDDIVAAEADFGKTAKDVDKSVKGQVVHYDELGISVEKIAKALDLTTSQVTEIIANDKKASDAAKQHKSAIDGLVASYDQQNKKSKDTIEALRIVIQSQDLSTDEIIKVRDEINKLVKQHILPMNDALAKWAAANRNVFTTLQPISNNLPQLSVAIEDLHWNAEGLTTPFDDAREALKNLASENLYFNVVETETGAIIGGTVVPVIGELVKGVEDAHVAINEAARSAKTFGEEMEANFTSVIKEIPSLLKNAFTGGGGLSGAGKAIGISVGTAIGDSISSKFGEAITDTVSNAMGKTVGNIIGKVVPIIGPLIGLGVQALMGIGKASKEELAGRKTEADFEKKFGGFDNMLGEISKAYADMGLSGKKAEADILAMFAAEKEGAEATEKAIKNITDVMDAAAAKAAAVADAQSHLADDVNARVAAGISTQESYNIAAQGTLATFGMLVEKNGDVIGAIKALGGSIDVLKEQEDQFGGAAKAAIDQLADVKDAVVANEDIYNAASANVQMMKHLETAGLETAEMFNAFGEDTSNQFNTLVQRGVSVKTAMTTMQPSLQRLWEEQQKFGDFTDEATNNLLKQAEEQGIVGPQMEDINKQLLDVLEDIRDMFANITANTKDFSAAINNIPTEKHVRIKVDTEGGVPSFANRPLERVTSAGFAMLHPGDVVGVPGRGQLSGVGGGGNVYVTVQGNVWAADELADVISQQIADDWMQRGGSMPLARTGN